jgi:uncharacterized RmlC-like cupin family protein
VNESRPVVVHPADAIAGPTTPGMEQRHHRDPDGRWVGWSGWIRNEAGDVSGWHHDAANDTYVYVIRGLVSIDFGPGGAGRVEARAGDLLLVPSQVVHREMTGSDEDLEAFVLRVGGEPEQVDVDGPEGAGR